VSAVAAVALIIAHLARLHIPGFTTVNVAEFLLALIGVAALGKFLEPRLGWRRTLVVIVLSAVGAAAFGALVTWGLDLLGSHVGWHHLEWDRSRGYVRGGAEHRPSWTESSPFPWLVAVLLASSGWMSTLWKRRVRIAVFGACTTAVLYFGHESNAELFAAALIGLVLGPDVTGGPGGPGFRGTRAATMRERRNLVALLVSIAALGPLLAHLLPGADGLLSPIAGLLDRSQFSPSEVAEICENAADGQRCLYASERLRVGGVGPLAMSLLPTFGVLVFAPALRRGRRAAWIVVCAVFAVWFAAAVAQIVAFGVNGEESVGAYLWTVCSILPLLVALVVLFRARRLFRITVPRSAGRVAGVRLLAAFAAGWIAYVGLSLAVGSGFATRPGFLALVVDFPRRLLPPRFLGAFDLRAASASASDPFPTTPLPVSFPATFVIEWVPVLTWLAVGAALVLLCRARVERPGDGTSGVTRALLENPGGADLSWMSTWDGNAHWIAPGERSAVAYRDIGGVFLTVGEAFGEAIADADARAETVRGFTDFALASGAIPCFYSVSEDARAACEAAGFRSVRVAEETVIELPELEFRGKKFQDIRTALNRAKKEEIAGHWTTWSDCPLAVREQIVEISESWVSDKGLPEMGFTLGGIEELDDPAVRLLIASDARGLVHGVTSWMPVYRDGELVGLTLDFMRRRSEGFRPVMEFLIATCALDAKDEGLSFVSLSAAPLASTATAAKGVIADDGEGAGTDVDHSSLDALLEWTGHTLEPVYGFRSLLFFKAKFQPRYEPLYMCYEDTASLGAIGAAVTRAYLGDVSTAKSARLLAALGTAVRGRRSEKAEQKAKEKGKEKEKTAGKATEAPEKAGAKTVKKAAE